MTSVNSWRTLVYRHSRPIGCIRTKVEAHTAMRPITRCIRTTSTTNVTCHNTFVISHFYVSRQHTRLSDKHLLVKFHFVRNSCTSFKQTVLTILKIISFAFWLRLQVLPVFGIIQDVTYFFKKKNWIFACIFNCLVVYKKNKRIILAVK